MPPKKAEDKKETAALTAVNEKGKATGAFRRGYFGKLPRQTVKTNDPAGNTGHLRRRITGGGSVRAAGVTLLGK